MKILASLLLLPLASCALVTTPVKVAGTAASTGIELTGKAVGAGIDALPGDGGGE